MTDAMSDKLILYHMPSVSCLTGVTSQTLDIRNTRKRQILRISEIPFDFAVEQA